MAGSEAHTSDTEGDSNSRARRAGILILNAGSSSLKYSLLDSVDQRAWIRESLDEPFIPDSGTLASAARRVVEEVRARIAANSEMVSVDAVAHRFVHGGSRFIGPVQVTREIRALLSELSDLAPFTIRPACHPGRGVAGALGRSTRRRLRRRLPRDTVPGSLHLRAAPGLGAASRTSTVRFPWPELRLQLRPELNYSAPRRKTCG